jgi:Tfp pilus assembly protein PilV
MAEIQVIIKRRVRASSLLEVIVSMVIIVVVFGLAMMMIANITRGSLSTEKIHAQAVLKSALINGEDQKEWISKTVIIDSVTVEQEVKPYTTGLLEVRLTAYDMNNQKMAELRKVVIKDNE